MKCPTCPDSTLLISERQGIEIDHCPTCRGVWLDRGELDKLIQLSSGPPAAGDVPRPAAARAERPGFEDSDFGKRRQGGRRSTSCLSEIFD